MGKDLYTNPDTLKGMGYIEDAQGNWHKPEFKKGSDLPKNRVPAKSKVPKPQIVPKEFYEATPPTQISIPADQLLDFMKNPPHPKANRKILNATKSFAQDGTPTDSKLEATMYNLLKLHHINFDFKVKYELQPAFEYNGKKIRPISWTPDFTLTELNMIVDTKGFSNETAPIKIKMVKFTLSQMGFDWSTWHDIPPEIIILKNKAECEKLINRILKICQEP